MSPTPNFNTRPLPCLLLKPAQPHLFSTIQPRILLKCKCDITCSEPFSALASSHPHFWSHQGLAQRFGPYHTSTHKTCDLALHLPTSLQAPSSAWNILPSPLTLSSRARDQLLESLRHSHNTDSSSVLPPRATRGRSGSRLYSQ